MISTSMSRTIRLYCGCSVTIRCRLAGQDGGLLQLPADEVADPGVADLAGPNGVVEKGERLVDRRQWVPGVGLVEVDSVDAEATQAGVEGTAEVRVRDRPASLGPSPIGKRPLA